VAEPPVTAANGVTLIELEAAEFPTAFTERTRIADEVPFTSDEIVKVAVVAPVETQVPEPLISYWMSEIAAKFAAPRRTVTEAEPEPFKTEVVIDGAAGALATIAVETVEASAVPVEFWPVAE
jgi:hypothetical protein